MDDVAGARVELAVVVAFGRIIPARLLAAVPMVNLHFSLLPRWRGAAPVERAILAGDRETGVCLMKVEEGLDTGPVYATRRSRSTTTSHSTRCGSSWSTWPARSWSTPWPMASPPFPSPQPQVGEVTLADKITREDLHLDWPAAAVQLARVVRLRAGLDHVPGQAAQRARRRGERRRGVRGRDLPGELRGDEVVTGRGSLRLLRVQPESRSPMSAEEWLRGVRPAASERLGTD